MQSAAHRSFTVVTVVTMIFAPVLKNHHWVNVLVGKTEETRIVQCEQSQPCPAKKHIKQKVVLSRP